jgi:hypothetical protein
MYRIIDRQGMGTMEIWVFKTKADIVEALASYHSVDFFGLLEDREATIYDYLKKFKTVKEKLDYLLDYGDWEIETIREER